MTIAPAFAIDGAADRLLAIFVGHGLLLGLAALALFPMMRRALGARSAWLCLAAAQFFAGTTYHAMSTRSEVLFGALICFAAAAVYAAFERDGGARWLVVGLCCGLAIACRRTALALPVAVVVVLAVDAVAGRPRGLRTFARRCALVAAGGALGMLPEVVASALHGGAIETYHPGVVRSHLSPFTRMWATRARTWFALQTFLRQPLYEVVAFAGAPLVIAIVLCGRSFVRRVPRSLVAAAGFTLLVGLGLAALSALHILRFAYGNPGTPPHHLYPRYLDPVETAMILTAVAVAAALLRDRLEGEERELVRAAPAPWILPLGLVTWVSGAAWRFRGGRLAPRWYFEDTALYGSYHLVLMGAVLLMLVALMAWWSLGRYGTVWTVLGAAVLGWALSLHIILRPGRFAERAPEPLEVLRSGPARASPRAAVAIPVSSRAETPRRYYEPAWRTDHAFHWPRADELGPWVEAHPAGFVLTRGGEPAPEPSLGLRLAAVSDAWVLWGPRR